MKFRLCNFSLIKTLECGLQHRRLRLMTTVWRGSKIFVNLQWTRCFQIMEKQTITFFFNQLAIMLTGCLWIKFHWEKNTLVSLYLACDDDICNWRRNQSMEFWSKDISLMLPPPTFGKREIIANFWLAKSWKIIEFALVRPSPKNPKSRADLITFVISRIT